MLLFCFKNNHQFILVVQFPTLFPNTSIWIPESTPVMHSRLLWPQPSLVKIHSLGVLLIVLLPLAIGLHIENKLRDH